MLLPGQQRGVPRVVHLFILPSLNTDSSTAASVTTFGATDRAEKGQWGGTAGLRRKGSGSHPLHTARSACKYTLQFPFIVSNNGITPADLKRGESEVLNYIVKLAHLLVFVLSDLLKFDCALDMEVMVLSYFYETCM